MVPNWNRNRALAADQESGEELLNDAFADITDNALEQGPDFLLYAFDLDLDETESLRLIATDRDPLQDSFDRRLDAVWANSHHVIGMESKRGATLPTTQLEEESQKLAAVADGQDVLLLVVTEDHSRPDTVDEADLHPEVGIEWRSWHDVALRIRNPPAELEANWGPTLNDAQKLFSALRFRGFDGMNDGAQFLKSVENLQVTLCTHVDGYAPGTQFPEKVRRKHSDLNYKPTTIHWKAFLLDDGSKPNAQGTDVYPCLLARDYEEELFIGLNLNTDQNRDEDDLLIATLHNQANQLAVTIVDSGMVAIEFPLGWFENPELDDGDKRSGSHRRHTDPEEIETLLAERIADGTGRFTARRVFIGYPVHDAEDVLTSCRHRLNEIESVFGYEEENQWSAEILGVD